MKRVDEIIDEVMAERAAERCRCLELALNDPRIHALMLKYADEALLRGGELDIEAFDRELRPIMKEVGSTIWSQLMNDGEVNQ